MGSGKIRAARESCCSAEFFFDAKKLIVFGDAIGARSGTGFDLARSGGNGEIGDERVFGFAAPVRNDGVVSGFTGELDSVDGFGDAADLIELDQDGAGYAFVGAAGGGRGCGDGKIG